MNDAERSFACALLLVASVAYAVIFGSVAVQIQEFDKTNIRYQERMDAINEFFKLNHLPASLRERTRMYIDSLWALNRGINYDAVLGELPRTIRQEIMMTMHAKLVALVPVFKKASKAFVKALVMELKPQVALPGDYIVREGENAEFMAFCTFALACVPPMRAIHGWLPHVLRVNSTQRRCGCPLQEQPGEGAHVQGRVLRGGGAVDGGPNCGAAPYEKRAGRVPVPPVHTAQDGLPPCDPGTAYRGHFRAHASPLTAVRLPVHVSLAELPRILHHDEAGSRAQA